MSLRLQENEDNTEETKAGEVLSSELRTAFTEHPEYVLALMFSVPDHPFRHSEPSGLRFLGSDDLPRKSEPAPLRLVGSKDTIFVAIALYELIQAGMPNSRIPFLDWLRNSPRPQ